MAPHPLLTAALLVLLCFPSPSLHLPCNPSTASAASARRRSSPANHSAAPALFVIGDSTIDVGTNNFLLTLARADRPPYGRDFDTHLPTGRFSNGRVVVDYLAERLGLPFPPPYLEALEHGGRMDDLARGVNYASAAAGILHYSGYDLGMHISLTQQMEQAADTIRVLKEGMGQKAAAEHVARSVFYVSIGSNDFIHYYLSNTSSVLLYNLPWEYNRLLAGLLRTQLKELYDLNVRKIVVMGLAPLGCTPHYMYEYGSEKGECVKVINDVMVEFNYAMKYMVYEFMREFPVVQATFCDAYEGAMDILANRTRYGIKTTSEACCGIGKYGAAMMCLKEGMECLNASTHVWWDEFHPTQAVNKILAENVWSGMHTDMCYPTNLKDMVLGAPDDH